MERNPGKIMGDKDTINLIILGQYPLGAEKAIVCSCFRAFSIAKSGTKVISSLEHMEIAY